MIWVVLVVALCSCKTNTSVYDNKANTSTVTAQDTVAKGAAAEGMAINISGEMWQAETYEVLQLGTFWVVKGTAADASVFSIMLPEPLANKEYEIVQGGDVSITYSTSRAKGFLFLAPYSDNNGWVKTTLHNGHLQGNIEVTVTNGGNPIKCVGMFNIKLR
jgi:hypothetical protein